VGAGATFIALIGAQIATSTAWDVAIEGRPFSWVRGVGALLALLGAALTAWAK
jgi:drug/metabolite transporter (DMT)-like permease